MERPPGSQPDAVADRFDSLAPAPPATAEVAPQPPSGSALRAERHSVTHTYEAVEASVPAARHVTADFAAAAGIAGEALDSVRLAVSEAVTNVVRHAYRGRTGRFQLTLGTCPGELWVLVSDDGCGHHTATRDPGLGLGLALIADACDEFVLAERAAGGTEAQMRFLIRAA